MSIIYYLFIKSCWKWLHVSALIFLRPSSGRKYPLSRKTVQCIFFHLLWSRTLRRPPAVNASFSLAYVLSSVFLCGTQYTTSKIPWQLHWHATLHLITTNITTCFRTITPYFRIRICMEKNASNTTINLNTPHRNTKTKDITLHLQHWILLENQILLQLQYIKLL